MASRKSSAAIIAGILAFHLAIIVSSDFLLRSTLAPIGAKEIAECAVCDPSITVQLEGRLGPAWKYEARRRGSLRESGSYPKSRAGSKLFGKRFPSFYTARRRRCQARAPQRANPDIMPTYELNR